MNAKERSEAKQRTVRRGWILKTRTGPKGEVAHPVWTCYGVSFVLEVDDVCSIMDCCQ